MIMGSPDLSRRGFYTAAIQGFGALITAALAIPAALYLLVKPKSKKAGQWVEAGEIAQFQPHKPEEVVFRRTRVDAGASSPKKTTAWVIKTTIRTSPLSPRNARTWAAPIIGTTRRRIFSARATHRHFRLTEKF